MVAALLGHDYRPGGLRLTRHLARMTRLAPGERLLDVAAGHGTAAMALAREFRLQVDGVDSSAANVSLASGAAAATGLDEQVAFVVGDPERLPFGDGAFDAVIYERAFATSPDMPAAARELARVLRPGGRAGITDVTTTSDRPPPELAPLYRIGCLGVALPARAYTDLLAEAGLRVTARQPYDLAIVRMLDQVEARLSLVHMTARARAEALGLDVRSIGSALAAARAAVADGVLGYTLLVAEKAT